VIDETGGLENCEACTAERDGRATSTARQGAPPDALGGVNAAADGEGSGRVPGFIAGGGRGLGAEACVSAMILLKSTLLVSTSFT
jgi:hypothetical protein